MKRIFDIVFSFGAILFFLPLALVLSLLIKTSSPGPIFYTCLRVGQNGHPIRCWKFRTMHLGAEERLKELLAADPKLQEEWDLFYKLKNDPRIFPVGKFLRKFSLDELPQFVNVLLGDLSVVGPRPVTHEEVGKYYGEKASKILSIKPGLTGLWQTSGRNLLTFDERIKLEESYIDKQSLFLDLKIICKTISVLFFPRGAY